MASKKFCSRFARVNVDGRNEDSKLHKALLKEIPNRQVANLVYAMYLQKGVKDAMDAKYQRNTQGEHQVSAVLEFLGFQNIMTDIADGTIRDIEKSKGIRDSKDKLVNFKDPLVAYKKAKEINDMTNAQGESAHLAASVVRHGKEFQVIVDPLSSKTNYRQRDVEDALFLWDALKTRMALNGVDMDTLKDSFGNILNMGVGMINYLESMAATDIKHLMPEEIQFFLSANSKSTLVQNLLNAFGNDLAATAQAVYDNFHVSSDPAYAGLMQRALKESRDLFKVLDADFNSQTLDKVAADASVSTESEVRRTLESLNKKFGIDYNEIKIEGQHAKTLSEATARAVLILERRINQLETRTGTREEVKKLTKLHDSLMRELSYKQYYAGITSYINEAYEIILNLEDALVNAPTNGTPYENAVAMARILENQNTYVDGYANLFRDLLGDLSTMEGITVDENISQEDIDNIKDLAEQAYSKLMSIKKRGEIYSKDCMTALCTHFLGDKIGTESIANVVEMCLSSNWGMDFVYSFGKLSDPMSAAIGDMVRTAQDDRNDELQKYTVRIREANALLHKSGSNSEFMYEDDGHIISDYDWAAYQKARAKARSRLQEQGYKDFELQEAMEIWEAANTDDLPVDVAPDGTVRRTEKVPALSLYRKKGASFRDRLTPAQNKYYDTMMQIKGEIGSLLPEYAQKQFLPPQLRRDLLDAAMHIKEDGMEKFGTAFKDKVEELWSVKQDDVDWGIYGEKEASYEYARGTLSGKQSQQIPIFFVNKLSNGDELFKNFSAGLQALAATAENYHHMSDILDIAEFMRTYIHNTAQNAKKNGKLMREAAGNEGTQIVSGITQRAQNFTMLTVLDNMFDKHFYGTNIKGNPFFTKVLKSMISYTSFKGLATNVFGGVANYLVGEQQILQMATANTLYKIFTKTKVPYFGLTDWALGFTKLFGAVGEAAVSTVTGKSTPSVILDLITNNKQSKDYLLAEYFDLFNENYGSMMHTKYHKGFRQLLHDISFVLYGAGEKAIRYNTLWAMCNARKLKLNGKTVTMREAFIKEGPQISPHLKLEANLYDTNGEQITDDSGNLTEYGKQFIRKFKKDLRYCCQGMFGAMNEEDKGVIHMHAIGKAIMNFRQWMVGHYSERFRGIHWDTDKHEAVRGYWTSSGRYLTRALTTEESRDLLESGHKIKFMGQFIKDLFNFRTSFIKEWTKASDTQKLDLTRLMSSVIMYALLFSSACWVGGGIVPKLGLGDEDDEKRRKKQMTPEQKFAYYQLKRMIFEAESSTPVGAFTNFETLVKSPIPAIRTFDNSMYFITGLGDIGTPLKSGPDKGMDKYWRNVLKYNLPFWRDFRRLQDFPESDAMFGMFETDQLK